MRSVLVTLFISLAGLVLTFAEQHPVVHNRLLRRCDNETQPWYYGNNTNTPSSWGTEYSGTGPQPTSYPSHRPCGGEFGGLQCPSSTMGTGPSVTPVSDNSSRTFWISPEQSTLTTTSSPSNETTSSATSGTSSSSTISSSGNATSSNSNTTMASGENTPPTPSSQSGTSTANGTTASGASNILPITVTTVQSTTTIWSLSPYNLSCSYLSSSNCGPHNGTSPAWGTGRPTGGPLWTNISSPASGYTIPGETDTSPESDDTVITITIEATPSPITPSPITPPPEEITLTATVPGSSIHTSSIHSGQGTAPLGGIGSETRSPGSSESAPITMTIVVGSNMTSIVSPSQPLASMTLPSNSSIISAISNSALTGTSESQAPPATASESVALSPTILSGSGSISTSTPSVESVSSPMANATASSAELSTDSSTSKGLVNATTTSALSSGLGIPPASITSSPYWTNATSSTPCSLTPSYLWRDWNWTTPSASSYINNSSTANTTFTSSAGLESMSQPTTLSSSNTTTSEDNTGAHPMETSPTTSTETSPITENPTMTSLAFLSSMPPATLSSADEHTNGTVAPTTGDWFAMTTLGDGSVLTTFSTHFGPALAASQSSVNAAESPSSLVRHHVVVPPKRMVAWAKMEGN